MGAKAPEKEGTMSKQQLEEKFNQMRQTAIDSNEPTAFVLAEWQDGLEIDSFSMQKFIEESGDEAVIRALEEMKFYGWRQWLIDIVSEQFISEPNAFELAWDSRAFYHEQRNETGTAGN